MGGRRSMEDNTHSVPGFLCPCLCCLCDCLTVKTQERRDSGASPDMMTFVPDMWIFRVEMPISAPSRPSRTADFSSVAITFSSGINFCILQQGRFSTEA